MHILFELADGLGAESVGYGFTFASMLGSISSVEETAVDRYEGVIVITALVSRPSSNPVSIDYLFKNPVLCPYTTGIADGSAIET